MWGRAQEPLEEGDEETDGTDRLDDTVRAHVWRHHFQPIFFAEKSVGLYLGTSRLAILQFCVVLVLVVCREFRRKTAFFWCGS